MRKTKDQKKLTACIWALFPFLYSGLSHRMGQLSNLELKPLCEQMVGSDSCISHGFKKVSKLVSSFAGCWNFSKNDTEQETGQIQIH